MEVNLRVSIDPGSKLFRRELREELSEVILLPSIDVRPASFCLDGVQNGLEIPGMVDVKNLLVGIAVVVVRSWHQRLYGNPGGHSDNV